MLTTLLFALEINFVLKIESNPWEQVRSVPYAYTHVRTWSDQKILKFLAIVSIFNILLVRNQDFVMKTPLWLNS